MAARARIRLRGLSAPALGLVAILLIAGCGGGGGERTFTAQGFVDAMNSNGAALALGPVLTTNPDGADVYSVELTKLAPSATGEGAFKPAEPPAASLLIEPDADAAGLEFDRCNTSVDLACFRAANAVMRVSNLQPSDRAEITTALESIEAKGG